MASEEISSEISKETIAAENTPVESQNNGQEEQEEDLQGSKIVISLFVLNNRLQTSYYGLDYNLTFHFRSRDESLGVGETRQGLARPLARPQ